MSKTTPAAAKPEDAQLSRFQKFEPRRLHRSVIKNAPYNPRTISDENRSWLKKKLQTRGLLKSLVWNEVTGNLVEGHQRLAILDALEGHGNYLLDMTVVQLSETEEREENIAFNGDRTGEWDMDLLADVLKTPGLELDGTGFTFADVQVAFDDTELTDLFRPNEPTKKALSDVEKQQKAAETKKRIQKERSEDNPEYVDRQDTETTLYVVFRTRAEREAAEVELGYEPGVRYVDGARVMGRLTAASADGVSDTPATKAGRSSTGMPPASGAESKPSP